MKKKTLVITAHPDDETLWFSSVILRKQCDVLCVTCGANQKESEIRELELRQAAQLLGVGNIKILRYPDIFKQRLDIRKLERDFRRVVIDNYSEVYTHGPFGDTNEHFHHQDICYVAHKVFDNVKCTAWNLYPDEVNQLTKEEYRLKKAIMGTVYEREFKKLKPAYEISSVEKFVSLSKDSVEIFYWAIANFGDRHEMLGQKYHDIWGYGASPYELERHQTIASLAASVTPTNILEIGAGEGFLTNKLAAIASTVDCVEKAPVYKKVLKKRGYKVVDKYDSSHYNLTVIASVLEYMDDPEIFLRGIESEYIIVDTIMSKSLRRMVMSLKDRYSLQKVAAVEPRWESMYHGKKKEKMETYRLGANIYLFRRK